MPILTATQEVRYAGQTVAAGGEFEASDKDARILVAIKKAVVKAPPVKPAKVDPPRVVEKIVEPEVTKESAPLARTYLRRDMQAEDGRTGETTSYASSRRGRQPRTRISNDSED